MNDGRICYIVDEEEVRKFPPLTLEMAPKLATFVIKANCVVGNRKWVEICQGTALMDMCI